MYIVTCLLSALLLFVSYAAGADCGGGPISCLACEKDDMNVINFVKDMPRQNFAGTALTNNIAYFDLLSCEGGKCEIKTPSDYASTSGPTTKSNNYIQGLAMYVALGVFLFLAFLVYYIALCCGRYICCCFCIGGCACCCNSYPTLKNTPKNKPAGHTSCCCGCLGYEYVGVSEECESGFAYSRCQKWGARILVFMFAFMVILMCIMLSVAGSENLTTSLQSTIDAPKSLAATVSGLNTPLHLAVSGTMAPFIQQTATEARESVNQKLDLAQFAITVNTVNAAGLSLKLNPAYAGDTDHDNLVTSYGMGIMAAKNTIDTMLTPANPYVEFANRGAEIQRTTQTLSAGIADVSDINIAITALDSASANEAVFIPNISEAFTEWPGYDGSGKLVDFDTKYVSRKLKIAYRGEFNTTASLGKINEVLYNYKVDRVEAAISALDKLILARNSVPTALLTILDKFKDRDLISADYLVTLAKVNDLAFSTGAAPAQSQISTLRAQCGFAVDGLISANYTNAMADAIVLRDNLPVLINNLNSLLEIFQLAVFDDIMVKLNTYGSTIAANVTLIGEVERNMLLFHQIGYTSLTDEFPRIQTFVSAATSLYNRLSSGSGPALVTAARDFSNTLRNFASATVGLTSIRYLNFLQQVSKLNIADLTTQVTALRVLQTKVSARTDTAVELYLTDFAHAVTNSAVNGGKVCRDSALACHAGCLCVFRRDINAIYLENIFTIRDGSPSIRTDLQKAHTAMIEVFGTSGVTFNNLPTEWNNYRTNAAALVNLPDNVINYFKDTSMSADIDNVAGINAAQIDKLYQGLLFLQSGYQSATLRNIPQALKEFTVIMKDVGTEYTDTAGSEASDAIGLLDAIDVCIPPLTEATKYTNLQREFQNGGFVSSWAYFSNALIQFGVCFDTRNTLLTVGITADNSEIKEISDISKRIDGSELPYGAIHYLVNVVKDGKVVPGSYPYQGRWDKDSRNQKYPLGHKCWTDKCLKEEIRFVNEEPLADVISGSGVPLSREQLTLLPMIFPLLSMVLLLLAILLPMICKCRCDGASRCMTNCSLFFLFIFCFLATIIFSALFFPVLLGVGDVCQSLENVGHKYVSQTNICDELGGTGNGYDCVIGSGKFKPKISIVDAYSDIFDRSCSRGALSNFWRSTETELSSITAGYVDDYFADQDNTFIGRFKDDLKDIMEVFKYEVEPGMRSVTRNFANSLTCESLSYGVTGLTDSVCCSVTTAFYWIACGYYLIVWSVLFCGIPGAQLGRKRFSNHISSPFMKTQLEYFSPHEEDAEYRQHPEVYVMDENGINGHGQNNNMNPNGYDNNNMNTNGYDNNMNNGYDNNNMNTSGHDGYPNIGQYNNNDTNNMEMSQYPSYQHQPVQYDDKEYVSQHNYDSPVPPPAYGYSVHGGHNEQIEQNQYNNDHEGTPIVQNMNEEEHDDNTVVFRQHSDSEYQAPLPMTTHESQHYTPQDEPIPEEVHNENATSTHENTSTIADMNEKEQAPEQASMYDYGQSHDYENHTVVDEELAIVQDDNQVKDAPVPPQDTNNVSEHEQYKYPIIEDVALVDENEAANEDW